MDKMRDATPAHVPAKNPLSYALIALGILLLAAGLPILFATSAVSKMIGAPLGDSTYMMVVGLVVMVAGSAMLAIGLRRR